MIWHWLHLSPPSAAQLENAVDERKHKRCALREWVDEELWSTLPPWQVFQLYQTERLDDPARRVETWN